GLVQVECLALRHPLDYVHQYYIGVITFGKSLCTRCTYIAPPTTVIFRLTIHSPFRGRGTMADFLTKQRTEIDRRLKELRPLVDEYQTLERARDALKGVASPRRGPGRPPGSRNRRPVKQRRRRRGGTRRQQAL